MATPVDFLGSNVIFHPAPGQEGVVGTLPAYRGPSEVISRWKLTEQEYKRVVDTGDIWVSVATAGPVPPMLISGFALMQIVDVDGDTVVDSYDPDEAVEALPAQ